MSNLPAPKSMNEQYKAHKIFVIYSIPDKCFYWQITYVVQPLVFSGKAEDAQQAIQAARDKIDELEGATNGKRRG